MDMADPIDVFVRSKFRQGQIGFMESGLKILDRSAVGTGEIFLLNYGNQIVHDIG